MKKHIHYLLFFVFIAFSCGDRKGKAREVAVADIEEATLTTEAPSLSAMDIYLVGSEINADGKQVAVIWKNGQATSISKPDADVSSIFITQTTK